MLRATGLALCVLLAPLQAQDTLPINFVWNRAAIGQIRFLYAGMRTEAMGCAYGRQFKDTMVVSFFVPAVADPRQATDSSVFGGFCFKIETIVGEHFVGIVHTHVRPQSSCFPSRADIRALIGWMRETPAKFGAIMCAQGDTLVMYGPNFLLKLAIPPLDSLYRAFP